MKKTNGRFGVVNSGRNPGRLPGDEVRGVIKRGRKQPVHLLPLFDAYVRLSRNYFSAHKKYLEPAID